MYLEVLVTVVFAICMCALYVKISLSDISRARLPKLCLPRTHTIACFCLFDLILYVPSTIFQLYRGESSWVEPVLS